MPEEKNIHKGHRQRMKNKFLTHGISIFEDHEILEILLYYVIPMQDTNPLAHRLLDTFGSLDGVFGAPYDELKKVPGIGENAAFLIKMIPQLSKRYYEALQKEKKRIYNTSEAVSLLRPKFIGEKEELLVLALLGSDGRLLYCGTVNHGSIHEVPVYIRTITKLAIDYHADSAILAHNHPSGSAVPSAGDIQVTGEIMRGLETIDVSLRDHIIFTQKNYCSFRDSGWLEEIKGRINGRQILPRAAEGRSRARDAGEENTD